MYVETYSTVEEVVDVLETQSHIFTIKVFYSETNNSYYLVFENIEGEDTEGKLPDDVVSVDIVDNDNITEATSENTQDDSDDDSSEEEEEASDDDSDDDSSEEEEEASDDESEPQETDNNVETSENDSILTANETKEEVNSLLPVQYSNSDLRRMIRYHLAKFTNISSDITKCKRFDLESVLYDYRSDLYNSFKYRLTSIHREKLIDNSESKIVMDNSLSNLFYEMVSTTVVISNTKKIWYYEDGSWKYSLSDGFLWDLISTTFIRYLENEDNFDKYVSYLEAFPSRKRILEDVKLKLLYPNFEERIDSNKNIIGMKEGIMEIDTGMCRESRVSDLVSKSTHIEYISMEDRKVNKLMKILKKVFPDKDVLRFFIRSCSTFLEGYNSKKVFYVWWGPGNNCKTGMSTLVQSALGDYCCTAPVSLITGRRTGSSEATPELCHLEGKLVVFLQEPNAGEKLKTGRIKEFTGNDKVCVRALYENQRDIDIRCKLVHVCNFPTAASNADAAFKRRVVVIKFTSMFVDKKEYRQHKINGTLNATKSNIFRIDENVDKSLRNLGDVFLGMLIEEYKVFREVGLQIPEIVDKSTQEFLTYNNLPLKYIRKNLIKSNNPSVQLTSSDIYESFKYWIRNLYPAYNAPSHDVFTKELNDEGFTEDENGFINSAIVSDKDILVNIS